MKLGEELWFSAVDDRHPVHPMHKKIIDERWSAYKAGKIKRITLAQLEERLKRK
jgi:hypothetical protein